MTIQWATGPNRYVWVNGNVNDAGLWEGLRMWSDRCGIVYTPAATLGQAQLIAVDPDEYAAAFGVSGFVGHNTTITDDGTGLGVVSYMTVRDDTGPEWDRAAVWAHEAGHAEGEVDQPSASGTLYSYTDVQDGPSQSDTERWQGWFGPSEAGTSFHCGPGSSPGQAGGIRGGGGNDSIWGDGGADRIYGNLGEDLLDGGADADTLYGGQGADAVSGGDGDDVLYGNLAADLLRGDGGADTLFGGQGNDTLSGGAGNDVLYGNLGADVLVGGAGADTIHVGEDDTVVGFEVGVDVLVLAGQGPPAVVADWLMA